MNLLMNWFVTGLIIGFTVALACRCADLKNEVERLRDRVDSIEKASKFGSWGNGVYQFVITNESWISATRDPLDNMPILGIDQNGAICPL